MRLITSASTKSPWPDGEDRNVEAAGTF